MAVWGGGDASLFVPPPDGEGIQCGYADYWVKHTPATRDVDAFTALARQRLVAAGWTVRSGIESDDSPDAVTPSHELGFWASKGDKILSLSDYDWRDRAYYDSDGTAAFELYRATPPWLRAATWFGGLLGALLGWLLTGWASRRTEGRPAISALGGTLIGAALVFLLPAVLLGAGAALAKPLLAWTAIDGPSITPFWTGLVYLGRGGAIWSGYFALAVLAMAAVPRRRPSMPGWLRRPLPWFFQVDLSSPGVYPALEAEVLHLPPVVGVQHVLADE